MVQPLCFICDALDVKFQHWKEKSTEKCLLLCKALRIKVAIYCVAEMESEMCEIHFVRSHITHQATPQEMPRKICETDERHVMETREEDSLSSPLFTAWSICFCAWLPSSHRAAICDTAEPAYRQWRDRDSWLDYFPLTIDIRSW